MSVLHVEQQYGMWNIKKYVWVCPIVAPYSYFCMEHDITISKAKALEMSVFESKMFCLLAIIQLTRY